MEIGKCNCEHAAVCYHGIERHFHKLEDGKQVYSDYCQEPDCKCERARIVHEMPSPTIQGEKAKWTRMVAEILG
jgi:hypothetical protein